jgi:hypothetical protein
LVNGLIGEIRKDAVLYKQGGFMFDRSVNFFGGPKKSEEAFAGEEDVLYSSVELDKNRGSSYAAMNSLFGSNGISDSRDVDVAEVVGKAVNETVLSRPLLQLQFHEQLGRRYLFEAKLNEMLKQGFNVDARSAKEFLIGLLDSGKFANLPVKIRTDLIKLSEIPAVRMEFSNEKVSVFNPKPHGFDLNLGYRPS